MADLSYYGASITIRTAEPNCGASESSCAYEWLSGPCDTKFVTILEALKIIQHKVAPDARPFEVFLACGFMPLHLQTLLTARLTREFPDRAVRLNTGLFGDLPGNTARISRKSPDAGIVIIEWEDLDSRLGFRRAGGWGPGMYHDIVHSAGAMLSRIQADLEQLHRPVVLSLPTLAIPPLVHNQGDESSQLSALLKQQVAQCEVWACSRSNVRVINSQRLGELSPPADRYDLNSHLVSGFPYSLSHADALAKLASELIRDATPKKGLITDLDDTLWFGLVGEIGSDEISWDLDHGSQMHGIYQQLLGAFAEEGVLIGVVSKNDLKVVERAFQRADLLVPPKSIWPIQVQWSAKSAAVERILQAWNIGADSVVFVDDSEMELAEVKATHPAMECLVFPKGDHAGFCKFLWRLRDLLGKPSLKEEDVLRSQSLRSSAFLRDGSGAGMTSNSFLQTAEATINFSYRVPPDPRALELINKTNQFNLNGRRYTDADWERSFSRPGAVVVLASYRDKYGPLGNILVLHGKVEGSALRVETWVMSCRAFSRRIEYKCLDELFSRFGFKEIYFDFVRTERNGPTAEFFASLLGREQDSEVHLTSEQFATKCPPLYFVVSNPASGGSN